VLLAGVLVAGGCAANEESAPPDRGRADLPDGHDAEVARVTDGDTIVVDSDVRVRLIGIDAPESRDPRTVVQCFGVESAAYLTEQLPIDTPVRLVYDVERIDRFGRDLAYVYRRADGLFVNAALVRDGYAAAVTYPPNVKHADEFAALASEAREAGRGLWSACEPAEPAPSGSCDASYPGVCIPPPPPDLDCADVPFRRFEVLPPDPHHFDGGGDGLGCELPS
jgi:endonuclease YncB( thermonuclease family)